MLLDKFEKINTSYSEKYTIETEYIFGIAEDGFFTRIFVKSNITDYVWQKTRFFPKSWSPYKTMKTWEEFKKRCLKEKKYPMDCRYDRKLAVGVWFSKRCKIVEYQDFFDFPEDDWDSVGWIGG